MATYEYLIDGNEYKVEIDKEYDLNNPDSLELLAKVMAEDYHYNYYGGWNENSVIKITILNGAQELDTFRVDIEYMPTFSVSRIDDEDINNT
ncbi:hypothetical protein [Snodgrassella communis]|uniref:hypothetical protein n=1 Tax=Snodgrassella communis TaxID=2946699 RepID=UPI000C1E6F68|nr:hypothetical protein [Snodgrassella communis]PIT22121.1 hypothetical protein BGI35_05410 [Snodgrassella communis]